MKDTIFIISFGLLIYLGFATVFGDTALMGSYGAVFASYNHKYFGYISYAYIFASLIPLYIFYKKTTFDTRALELGIASFLILFSFLLAQAIVVRGDFRGEMGGGFVDFLSPFIGSFGLWTFWLIITLVSMVIIFDRSAHEMVDILYKKFKEITVGSAESITKKKFNIKNGSFNFENAHVEKQKEKKIVPPVLKQTNETSESEIDKPAYLRREEDSPKINQHNILELVHDIKEQKNAIIVDELEENAKLLASIEKGEVEKPKNFKLPSVEFLQKPNNKAHSVDESELDGKIKFLIEKLAHFKIEGDVVRTYAGPVVSTFEFKPAANVKVSRILSLQDDLAMALSAETIRIQAPIPGKDVVGIEIPNEKIDTIYLRELLDSKLFKESSSPLTIVLGKDIVGKPFITDLKKLPHLLIAGTTGSGKSVGINAMILSLLYKNSPDQLRLLMIDPKMLEFSIYNDIPHLLTPVITKAKQAIVALNNMVYEMERRYALMSENRTKNIESYNEKVKKEGGEHLPYIVVIIDELADLMMTSGKDVEYSIARLAQMARASGIHLVVATQRPSVDVVTGLIKANLPSRISYRVGQKIDSKIILDQQGAESLLGKGDMLFTPPGSTGLVRLHAPWSTEEEIEKIVDFIKSQRAPNYDKRFLIEDSEASNASMGESYEELDPMFDEAKNVILSDRKTSISYLQRKLQIGYNKSARLIEQLENEGILSAPNSKGIRDIL
ncbi:MAG: segregation ATPase FtsK/SpoIIIE, family [Campylobacterota bacterium]|nr:segregation ATPase FtsK/SpoIIIE, family [Campylobacterota bacterium]MDQ1268287.1 segregation ATPase FtsK/SpoIIIE, family [Campylobacterota bacterium]